jgi:hypothetical protein
LTIEYGGTLSSDNGSVTISGGLALNKGELRQGGGILNLISGGSVGPGELDVSDSELKLGDELSITGTLVVNSGTTWSDLGGTVDLSTGTLESGGGTFNLDDFTIGANSTFRLSGDTEISSVDDLTLGNLELGGNTLSLDFASVNNATLILPNTLAMDTAGSIIDTGDSSLTLSNPLNINAGSIASTGGTLSFAGGLTLGAEGALDVTDSTFSVSQALNLSTASFTSSVLDLQAATTLSSGGLVHFGSLTTNGNVLTLGSVSTHLKLNDALTLNGVALETGAGSLTLSDNVSLSVVSAAKRRVVESSGRVTPLKSCTPSTSRILL